MRYDEYDIKTRVARGKSEEAKCLECLRNYGWVLENANSKEDRFEKTDAFWIDPETKERHRIAVKVRDTKNDILVAVRDPWFGLDHPNTVMGRDVKYEYKYYITRSVDKTKLRIASGKRIHQIIDEMMKEAEESNWKFPLNSNLHLGCQLRYHVDRYSGLPKILGFVNPNYLEADEIMYIAYKE